MSRFSFFSHSSSKHSYSLIELLIVIAIIAILAMLTIGVYGYAHKQAGKSRAKGEIIAMETALDRYKIDNGFYPAPPATSISGSNYVKTPSSYLAQAGILLTNLWGGKISTNAPITGPLYMEFRKNQVGGTGNAIYALDPFGNPYGYAAGSNAYFNTNFVDIWCTSGQNGSGSQTNALQWISNWRSN